tara:strand:- start:1821 stop:2405 length:585 start_codon:yes stop_codon:yes gene_type:complete
MAQESLLKKEFKSKDVNRARNLVNKDFSAKTIDGVGYQKAYQLHEEGDIWEENGRTWTIKDGIRQNITKLDGAKKALQIPLACPKCGGPMKHWLAKKMYKIHGFCFDPCTVEYEAELRKAGLYDQYEKSMMQGGLRAFIRDVEQWAMDQINTVDTFVTEQGDVEDWNSNRSKANETINENLQEFLKHARKHLED